MPIVLVKLWSVLPRLFEWPPVRSVAHLLERLSLLALVGGILFELVTGLLNISNDYVFGFSFYTAHLYGAVVFIAGFVVHVCLKLRLAWRAIRRREKPADGPDELAAPEPGPSTISRRGVVAARRGIVARRRRALRRPDHRRAVPGDGPAVAARRPGRPSFPVNRTARTARGREGRRRVAPDARRHHAR